MSLLGSQVYANADTAIWLPQAGGVITGGLTVEKDVYARNVIATQGTLAVQVASVPKISITNAANQSYIQSDDVLYFSRLGGMAQSSLSTAVAPALDVFTTGKVVALQLDLADTGAAPVVGSATLVGGTAIISTTAADVTSYILLTHTNLNASTAVGTLRVSNKGANNFTVVSVSAAGVQVAGDLSSFDWMIVNAA